MDYSPPDRNSAATAHAADDNTTDNLLDLPAMHDDNNVRLSEPPPVTWVEWDHLRFRVIALEKMLVAVLAEGTFSRLDRFREMTHSLAQRKGCVEHPLNLLSAAQIVHLVEQARRMKKHPQW
jgi:hypothetical protein